VTDSLTKKQRSERMGLVKSANTSPEMAVRRIVHGLGYRYALHRRDLPGRPDIVLGRQKKVIFVHGCFWHRHAAKSCRLARLPKSRLEFWLPKLESNRLRDQRNYCHLKQAGWKIMVVWECQLSDKERIKNALRSFLGRKNASR